MSAAVQGPWVALGPLRRFAKETVLFAITLPTQGTELSEARSSSPAFGFAKAADLFAGGSISGPCTADVLLQHRLRKLLLLRFRRMALIAVIELETVT